MRKKQISFCLSQYISISHVPRYHKFCGKDLFRLFYKIFSQIGWDTIDPEGIKPVDLNGFGIQIILFKIARNTTHEEMEHFSQFRRYRTRKTVPVQQPDKILNALVFYFGAQVILPVIG